MIARPVDAGWASNPATKELAVGSEWEKDSAGDIALSPVIAFEVGAAMTAVVARIEFLRAGTDGQKTSAVQLVLTPKSALELAEFLERYARQILAIHPTAPPN